MARKRFWATRNGLPVSAARAVLINRRVFVIPLECAEGDTDCVNLQATLRRTSFLRTQKS